MMQWRRLTLNQLKSPSLMIQMLVIVLVFQMIEIQPLKRAPNCVTFGDGGTSQ
uniref:Uncharacterized protein n=1 Tax=Picea glauca TaxID=3330 RepID=A0A101M1R5_PICGL|nr:hypothetical protein ABT39_MTgene3878 [Picea glauca]